MGGMAYEYIDYHNITSSNQSVLFVFLDFEPIEVDWTRRLFVDDWEIDVDVEASLDCTRDPVVLS